MIISIDLSQEILAIDPGNRYVDASIPVNFSSTTFSTSDTQKRDKITENKVRESLKCLPRMTKSNEFEHLEIKLLRFSYLLIKS